MKDVSFPGISDGCAPAKDFIGRRRVIGTWLPDVAQKRERTALSFSIATTVLRPAHL